MGVENLDRKEYSFEEYLNLLERSEHKLEYLDVTFPEDSAPPRL